MLDLTSESTVKSFIKYAKGKGLTDNGIAGALGNLYAESGVRCNNLQNSSNKSFGMTDEEFTEAVDKGSFDFLQSKNFGYGIAQWTTRGRRKGLYDLKITKGVSIADEQLQFEYLFQELNAKYKSVLKTLTNPSATIRQCTEIFVCKFEVPASVIAGGSKKENAIKTRAKYAQEFYDKFLKEENMEHLRTKAIEAMRHYLGAKKGDALHREIVDTYNAFLPSRNKTYTRASKMTVTYDWCAATVSAALITCGYTDIFYPEMSCGKLITSLKALGSWVEDESVTPEPGWLIFYDWDDNGKGDDTAGHDHVGMVESVTNGYITTIEGNYSNVCKRRKIAVNGRYIRGYGALKYDDKVTVVTKTEDSAPAQTNNVKIESAKYKNATFNRVYKAAATINVRAGAGTNKAKLTMIPKGTQVRCYGYYNMVGNVKWLLVTFTYKNVKYSGYCHGNYLA